MSQSFRPACSMNEKPRPPTVPGKVDCRHRRYDLSTMKMRKRIVIAALGALVFIGCGEPTPICDNQVIRQAISPDGAMKAVLFHRVCGGPTGFSSQVSVFDVNEPVTGKGTFIADTEGGHAKAAAWGGPDVYLEWTAPRALTVTFAYLSRVIASESPVRGVQVTYQSARE